MRFFILPNEKTTKELAYFRVPSIHVENFAGILSIKRYHQLALYSWSPNQHV